MEREEPALAETSGECLDFVLAEISVARPAGMDFNCRERGVERWEAVALDCFQGLKSFAHRHDLELPIVSLHDLTHRPAEQIGQAP
jgi:hypothetical protein